LSTKDTSTMGNWQQLASWAVVPLAITAMWHCAMMAHGASGWMA
jgi:hypothetical protein